MARQFAMQCPHCNGRMKVEGVKRISPLLTERVYQCLNEHWECNFRYVSSDSPMRVLVSPVIKNPAVDIPMATKKEILCE